MLLRVRLESSERDAPSVGIALPASILTRKRGIAASDQTLFASDCPGLNATASAWLPSGSR